LRFHGRFVHGQIEPDRVAVFDDIAAGRLAKGKLGHFLAVRLDRVIDLIAQFALGRRLVPLALLLCLILGSRLWQSGLDFFAAGSFEPHTPECRRSRRRQLSREQRK
jgi:hypothetical protein